MRTKTIALLLTLGACTANEEGTTPSWFEDWSPLDDTGVSGVDATHFVTLDLPEGVMTAGAVTSMGEAVSLTSGVASYHKETTTVYLSDESSLYRLEPDTLSVTPLTSFEDPSGPVTGILSMHRLMLEGEEILLARTTNSIRILDVETLMLSVPLLLLDVDTATGAPSAFEPRSMTIVPSFQASFGNAFVAVGHDGLLRLGHEAVLSDQIVIAFQILPVRLMVCGTNDAVEAEQLLAPVWPEASSLGPEHLLIVNEGFSFVLHRDLCVYPLQEIVDQNEHGIMPIYGFEVDFNQDGFDSVLWVHQ